MGNTGIILALAAVVCALRMAGLALANARLSPPLQRSLQYIPIAVFAALLAPSLAAPPGGWAVRCCIAAGCAVLLARRSGRPWVILPMGSLAFWLMQLIAR